MLGEIAQLVKQFAVTCAAYEQNMQNQNAKIMELEVKLSTKEAELAEIKGQLDAFMEASEAIIPDKPAKK